MILENLDIYGKFNRFNETWLWNFLAFPCLVDL